MHLSTRDVQRLLTAAGYYKGGIDGDAGPKTHAAIESLLSARKSELPGGKLNDRRRMVAAAQLVLKHAGFEPGTIDGYSGHNTLEAFNAWAYEREHGHAEVLGRDEAPLLSAISDATEQPGASTLWPRQSGVSAFYGSVGKNQTTIALPYPMVIAWNTRQSVSKMTCHEKVADAMAGIFDRTLDAYGLDRIKALGLNMYGGCLNVRKMRGGSSYSMHSWGIAVDLDPANNQLRWNNTRARFAKPDYEEFWRIVEAAGAVSLGRARNFDWMHFQFARL